MSYELGNNLRIEPENPEMHETPKKCVGCGVKWYFGGHFCVEKLKPSKTFRRSVKGYFDGNDDS